MKERDFSNLRLKLQPFSHFGAKILQTNLLTFIIMMGVSFYSIPLRAQSSSGSTVKYDFDLNVKTDSKNLPDSISGKLSITNFDAASGNCLFIPFNWSGYGLDRGSIKRFNDITSQRNVLQLQVAGRV